MRDLVRESGSKEGRVLAGEIPAEQVSECIDGEDMGMEVNEIDDAHVFK